MSIDVNIVSAEQEIFSGKADMLVATAINGEVGVKKNHAPMLAFLKPGQVRLTNDETGSEEVFYISGGFLEVQPNCVTVLSDTALRAEDLDEAKALEAEQRARRKLEEEKADLDYAEVLSQLANATAQIEALKRLRSITSTGRH